MNIKKVNQELESNKSIANTSRVIAKALGGEKLYDNSVELMKVKMENIRPANFIDRPRNYLLLTSLLIIMSFAATRLYVALLLISLAAIALYILMLVKLIKEIKTPAASSSDKPEIVKNDGRGWVYIDSLTTADWYKDDLVEDLEAVDLSRERLESLAKEDISGVNFMVLNPQGLGFKLHLDNGFILDFAECLDVNDKFLGYCIQIEGGLD